MYKYFWFKQNAEDDVEGEITIIIEKKDGLNGFILLFYGSYYKTKRGIDIITYIDYLEFKRSVYNSEINDILY